MSGEEDPIQRALSGFSLYTLGDGLRQGTSIAVVGKELERYEVGPATVVIANDGGVGRYVAVEPSLTEREKERLSRLLDHLFMSISPEDAADPSKRLIPNMVEAARSLGFLEEVTRSLQKYEYYVKRELKGYGRLDVLMNDFNIEDIKCTGHGRPVVVLHKNHSELGWIRTNVVFPTEEDAQETTQKMLQRCGTMATNAMPIVDARTPTNDRVAVRWSTDVSMTGTAFTIRKFPAEPMPITALVMLNTVSPLMVAYLWLMLEARGFALIVGPTGSGKTTFMNTLASLINPNAAVCTIEDNPELRLSHDVWDQLTSRHSYSIGQSGLEITLQDLVKHSLRLTPDFVIVGEVRGEEVAALINSAASGHGALTSLHSDSVQNVMIRMSAPPMLVPTGNMMLIWAFVVMNRVRREHGRVVRRVLSITELDPRKGGFDLKEMFTYNMVDDTFSPAAPEELVRMKTERLQQVMRLFGWDEKQLETELGERASYIEMMVANKLLTLSEVGEAVRKFYIRKYGLAG
ncbi:MAG: type II/IV secretion system ATPase subunit [Nitrososphaerota archaeon]|nr:type II/IV secretion system ATPase subunit [Nitrososphaerota archaeon]MDG7013206.1 type II/IV secretion system ATPase subunit [Nitrososphaerota archaeon]MDG7026287.1 type II/IV secretion system ATPase subunit [Nitrososphaerota archaeon]